MQSMRRPADDRVLAEVYRAFHGTLLGQMFRSHYFEDRLADLGLTMEQFNESLLALDRQGLLTRSSRMANGTWLLRGLSARAWLALAESDGVNVSRLRQRLLRAIVDDDETSRKSPAIYLQLDVRTTEALLSDLQSSRLITYQRTAQSGLIVMSVDPLAHRALDDD